MLPANKIKVFALYGDAVIYKSRNIFVCFNPQPRKGLTAQIYKLFSKLQIIYKIFRMKIGDPHAIAELMAVLPPFLRGVRPSGRAWTVSRASYVHELAKYIIFHLDCKKLTLRVWEIPEDVFLGIEPKHGSAKEYVIHYFEPTRIYQKEENTIFSEQE